MAARVAPADYDQLHHFVAVGPWDEAPLEAELLAQANRLVGGPDAILVIDDTALLKKGTHSVGVASQYAGVVGKNANCQTLVSLTLAKGEVPVPLVLRLFLPETWIRGSRAPAARRCARGVLDGALQARDRAGGTAAGHAGWGKLRGGSGRCGLRHQRLLPPGALGARTALGRGNRADPEGLCGRCEHDRVSALAWAVPHTAHPGSGGGHG